MTPEEADRALESIWSRMPADTHQVADIIAASFHPGIPMLVRVAAIARVCATAGLGLYEHVTGEGHVAGPVQRMDSIPDIVTMLRAAADLLEASHKPRADG